VKRALLLLLLAAGCHPKLYAASVPPPGAVGVLHTKGEWAKLTEGTVLAFTCEKWGGACIDARATSDDPAIAEVKPAAVARLHPLLTQGSQIQQSTFVIVGKRPGKTRIRVHARQGHKTLDVTVLAAPAL
jgi:hypothetical protein